MRARKGRARWVIHVIGISVNHLDTKSKVRKDSEDTMASIQRIVRRHYERQANSDAQALPTPSTRREVSKTEAQAPYVPATHRSLFCFHEIPLFQPCKRCNRDKHQGQLALGRLLRHYGVAVQ